MFISIQAKQQYEREERRKELKRQRGEDTWMLPEINERLQQIEGVRCIVFHFELSILATNNNDG